MRPGRSASETSERTALPSKRFVAWDSARPAELTAFELSIMLPVGLRNSPPEIAEPEAWPSAGAGAGAG